MANNQLIDCSHLLEERVCVSVCEFETDHISNESETV